MNKAKIKFEWRNNNKEAIWSKYMFIAAYGLVTASENKTLGAILEDEKLSKKVKGIMTEIQSIRKAENIKLPHDIVEISYLMAKNFPYEGKPPFKGISSQKTSMMKENFLGKLLLIWY